MDKYELKLESFQGPLEKLLQLIEAKELEITRLSLAEVTADFLDYVGTLQEISPRLLADFIAVAARLILIKSHAILPNLELTEEEEEDIAELEARLKLYKQFRAVEKSIADSWNKRVGYRRAYLLELPGGFYLSEALPPKKLKNVIEKLYNDLESFIPKTEEGEVRLVSLEDMIEEMILRVGRAIKTNFDEVTEGKGKSEIIVLFLALLHLLKESKIDVRQEGLFSEIQISINNG